MPFADPENGTGFELELASEVIRRLFGDVEIEFVGVSGGDRFTALSDGAFDILVRLTTRTGEREALASPTATAYLTDGLSIVVGSGAASVPADLSGSSVAVIAGSLTLDTFQAWAESAAIAFEYVETENRGDQVEAVESGQADGMLLDLISGIHHSAETGRELVVVGDFGDFVPMWTADADFAAEVDAVLNEVLADGTWAALFESSFGFSPPWAIADLQP